MIDNYKDLTIGKFMDVTELLEEYANDDTDLVVNLIALLSDKDIDDVERMPLAEFNKCVRSLSFLKDKPKTNGRIPSKITINGRRCRVEKDCFSVSAGQYIDLRGYLKSLDDLTKNLDRILTVFIIPEDAEGYGEGYDLNEFAKEIRDNVGIELASTMSAFFLRVSRVCINRILDSLRDETIQEMARNPMMTERMEEAMSQIRLLRGLVNDGVG